MNKVPMTMAGAAALEEELQRLKTKDRPAVIAAISEARAHGDLKENAEYHAAKEQQGFIEGRIRDIEAKLSNAQIIDISKIANDGRVIFGSTVTITNIETDDVLTYMIVGEDESDIGANKISVTSPIARAVIGKYSDEEVVVQTPSGEVEYVIDKVEYI